MQENIQRHLRGIWLEMSPQRKMLEGKKHLFWNRTELGVKPPHTPSTSCSPMCKLHHLSEPGSSHLHKGILTAQIKETRLCVGAPGWYNYPRGHKGDAP